VAPRNQGCHGSTGTCRCGPPPPPQQPFEAVPGPKPHHLPSATIDGFSATPSRFARARRLRKSPTASSSVDIRADSAGRSGPSALRGGVSSGKLFGDLQASRRAQTSGRGGLAATKKKQKKTPKKTNKKKKPFFSPKQLFHQTHTQAQPAASRSPGGQAGGPDASSTLGCSRLPPRRATMLSSTNRRSFVFCPSEHPANERPQIRRPFGGGVSRLFSLPETTAGGVGEGRLPPAQGEAGNRVGDHLEARRASTGPVGHAPRPEASSGKNRKKPRHTRRRLTSTAPSHPSPGLWLTGRRTSRTEWPQWRSAGLEGCERPGGWFQHTRSLEVDRVRSTSRAPPPGAGSKRAKSGRAPCLAERREASFLFSCLPAWAPLASDLHCLDSSFDVAGTNPTRPFAASRRNCLRIVHFRFLRVRRRHTTTGGFAGGRRLEVHLRGDGGFSRFLLPLLCLAGSGA